ncbi:two-component system response regulator [Tardibacter chloracetimidivorans]|uniref:Two-component system response regulator n=1 Tax=Tardibacter chloracetimidivorans TaxID=1921510 RepID=A0A1L3ZZ53_9SPHN|nr:ANTAR domain-containing protein [Tardibacter chloracetimidivorans]API60914.1 two-component system response regulator [Tardibacter chloracetimidivorans]
MRIVIIDETKARAAVIEAGLREAGLSDIHILSERQGLVSRLAALAADVVLIDLSNPSRDVLEEYFTVSRALARPVAMFVDQSIPGDIEAAIDAGVSAYVVDGFRKERIKPVLDLAVSRFNAFARLQNELNEARNALADRKAIDKAKALLMRRRGIDEPAAYALLRKAAMNQGRRIGEVAAALIAAEELLGDGQ